MPEWLSNLLIAVGGGSVVLLGILTVFKNLLIKLFETGIESSFERSLHKFKNNLERTTRAYEILLGREMRFYEKIEPIMAELIPLSQDLVFYVKREEEIEHAHRCESFRTSFLRYCELIKLLKNESLTHQAYIPLEILNAFSGIVAQMQQNMHFWFDMGKFLFSGEYDKIDTKRGENITDTLLKKIAMAEALIKKRLMQLSGENA